LAKLWLSAHLPTFATVAMALSAWPHLCCLLLLVTACAAARQKSLDDAEVRSTVTLPPVEGFEHLPPLCDAEIVERACQAMDMDNNPTTTSVYEVAYMLSATRTSTIAFLEGLGMDMGDADLAQKYQLTEDPTSFSCADLCGRVLGSIPEDFLPPTSDVGCRSSPEGGICDIDLSPAALDHVSFHSEPMDFHSNHPVHQPKPSSEMTASPLAIQGHAVKHGPAPEDVSAEEAAIKVANLFRIYPMGRIAMKEYGDAADDDKTDGDSFVEEDELASASTGSALTGCKRVYCHPLPSKCRMKTLCGDCKACREPSQPSRPNRPVSPPIRPHYPIKPSTTSKPSRPVQPPQPIRPAAPQATGWRAEVEKVSIKSQAYVARAIQLFMKDQRQLAKWFGSTTPQTREKVLKVMNSLSSMLDNVEYTRNSPQCGSNTYAFVYPRGPLAKNNRGQFVFHLCSVYFKSDEGEKIETLTHEGSHHATAYTDDVCADPVPRGQCRVTAYGRPVCQEVARRFPSRAIENADNFCYYINDINTMNP